MAYRIAGIDVHKKKLAVVVADVEVDDEYQFERRWFGRNPEQLQRLAEWFVEQRVEEVVMRTRTIRCFSIPALVWAETCWNRIRESLIGGFGLTCSGSRTPLSPKPSKPSLITRKQLEIPREWPS